MYFANCPVHDHSKSTPCPQQPFRFLDLPPEIRNRIASLALSSPSHIDIRKPQWNRHTLPSPEPMFLSSPRLDYPLPRTPPPTPPCEDQLQIEKESKSRERDGHSRLALLMACRQTYLDHWSTYYGENEFFFKLKIWESFRETVPERCLNEIRHIRFRMPYRTRQMDVWRSLAELEHLESVAVVLGPPEIASRLERASCIAGSRMCLRLKKVSISREGLGEGIAPLGEGQDAVIAKRECREDAIIERFINKTLESRGKRPARSLQRSARKASSRAGSQVRGGKRMKRINSPAPDERSMDEYFQMLESAADEVTGGEQQQV